MKILVIGDRIVSCELLVEAAQTLSINEEVTIKEILWDSESRQDFQKKALNIEKSGPEAEEIPVEAYKEIEDTDILLAHFCPVPKALIDKGRQLKLIGTCRGGMEHIDIDAATAKNIPVIHCIRNAEATSDFAVGLMFAETRNIARAHAAIKNGNWRKNYINNNYTTSMRDMTVGIVGLGHIGKLVAEKCIGIGMKVIAYDPFITQGKINDIGLKVTMVSCEDIFKTSDIVSLHLRVTPATKNFINEDLIKLMKPTAYLINTSRAGVLDKNALIDALQKKTIGGAALDVFWEEPLSSEDPILQLDNITLTPHNAGNVVDALPKSPLLLARTINDFWKIGKSDMVINLNKLNK